MAEESFKKNRVLCTFATADDNCTLGFVDSGKARPKSLIKGNELKNPKPIELVLKRKSGAKFFDELVIGDKKVLDKYRKQIEGMVAVSLLNVNLYEGVIRNAKCNKKDQFNEKAERQVSTAEAAD